MLPDRPCETWLHAVSMPYLQLSEGLVQRQARHRLSVSGSYEQPGVSLLLDCSLSAISRAQVIWHSRMGGSSADSRTLFEVDAKFYSRVMMHAQ